LRDSVANNWSIIRRSAALTFGSTVAGIPRA
jgi:hypothetical protein